MKTSHIWPNCFLKELNISEVWKNRDVYEIKPRRQDVFWVECLKDEITEHILPKINDTDHKLKIINELADRPNSPLNFIISRGLNYFQCYPFMKVEANTSLWLNIGETLFSKVETLESIRLPEEEILL